MNDELHLFEIVPAMQNSHLMLKLDFLQTLLKTASKSEKPYKNADFVRKIGFSFNNQYKTSPGLSQVFSASNESLTAFLDSSNLEKSKKRNVRNLQMANTTGEFRGEFWTTFRACSRVTTAETLRCKLGSGRGFARIIFARAMGPAYEVALNSSF